MGRKSTNDQNRPTVTLIRETRHYLDATDLKKRDEKSYEMVSKPVMVGTKEKTENERVVSMPDKSVTKLGVTTDCDGIYIAARIQISRCLCW